jgi:hypothetical protein
LAGHQALGLGQGLRGGLDVGVIEDDRGGLAAEFQRDPGNPLAPGPPVAAKPTVTPDSRGHSWTMSSDRFLISAPIARR